MKRTKRNIAGKSKPAATGKPSRASSPAEAPAAEPSSRRHEANAANAQLSTGPRTPEGKMASARNSFKHGLSIQRHLVLPGEDSAAYRLLLAELEQIYEPCSGREALAVEDMAQCRWAFARFDQAEAFALERLTGDCNRDDDKEEDALTPGEALGLCAGVFTDFDLDGRTIVRPDTEYPAFTKIHRYRSFWERRHARALAELERAQRARRAEEAERRADAEARRRSEAHALKQRLTLAREERHQELHEVRIARLRLSPVRAAARQQGSAGLVDRQAVCPLPDDGSAMSASEAVRSAAPAQDGFVSLDTACTTGGQRKAA